jgi:hypothetical protein
LAGTLPQAWTTIVRGLHWDCGRSTTAWLSAPPDSNSAFANVLRGSWRNTSPTPRVFTQVQQVGPTAPRANVVSMGTLDKQESHRIRCAHNDAGSFPKRSTQPMVSSRNVRRTCRRSTGLQEDPGKLEKPCSAGKTLFGRKTPSTHMNSATRLFPTALPQLSQGKPKYHRSIPLGSIFVKPRSMDPSARSAQCNPQAWWHARSIKPWIAEPERHNHAWHNKLSLLDSNTSIRVSRHRQTSRVEPDRAVHPPPAGWLGTARKAGVRPWRWKLEPDKAVIFRRVPSRPNVCSTLFPH